MNKGMINRRIPGNKGYESRYILSKVTVFLAALFLCALFAVVKPVEVKAGTYSGTVKTSQFSDNEEVNITGNTEIIIDSAKKIKTLNSDIANITVKITGDTNYTLECEEIEIGNDDGNDATDDYGTLIINSANLMVTKKGITAKNIEIYGGTIKSYSDNNNYAIHGVNGVVVINGGNVTAEGGDGIFLDSNKQITISNNAEVTATGRNFGIISSTGNINIDNATVTATGKEGDFASGISTNGNVTITNATVTAKGVPHAIYSTGGPGDNKISISGASTVVKASCENGAAIEVDQYTLGKMTISEPLEVSSPVGGGVSHDGKFIATEAGGTVAAKEVEIKRRTYTVTVENDGNGSGTADPSKAYESIIIKLSATPKDGYVFYEWTSEDGITFADSNSANTTFNMIDANVKVKANFKPKRTIIFDANGGEGEMDPQAVGKGVKTQLNKNEFTREGYAFKEWNTEKDGSGQSYGDGESVTLEEDIKLYAQWIKGDENVKADGDIKVKVTEETLNTLNDSLDPELKTKVEEALSEGKEVEFVFRSKETGDDAEGADDISGYSKDKGYTLGEFFDLTLDVMISGEKAGSISNTSGKVRLDVLIKEALRKNGRLFHILRFHGGDVSEVGSGRGSKVPIETDGFSTYAITYEDDAGKDDDDDDDDDDDHEEHKPASWELNPNEKQQLVIVWQGTGKGFSAGYQEQGDIAKSIIKSAIPAGWKEAFSFNLLVNGKTDTSLKNGTITFYIPSEYLKTTVSAGQAGRQFAIVAMDKNGKTYLLTDTDTNPNTITVNVAFEGYAMELIYK